MMLYEVRNLCFSYPGAADKTLSNCSLTLSEGETLCILGPNGAGKSTLLNCMCGLLSPESGSIRLCGRELSEMTAKEIATEVGYVQQNHVPVFGYSVFHFVLMGAAPRIGLLGKPSRKEEERTMEALRSLGIAHLAEKPYTEISGGERQQATIARALVQNPRVILFDEPTAHLDFGRQLMILRRIREMTGRGFAAILTTHNPDHAILLGGKVAVLDRSGTITVGTAEEILTEERLKTLYQTDLSIRHVDSFGREICAASHL